MPIKNSARAHRSLGSAALAVVLFAGLTACAPAQDAAEAVTPNNGTPAATATKSTEPESIRGTLVKVISGDTLVISPVSDTNGEPTGEPDVTVHVLGISAPKIDECGGPEAAAELDRIIISHGFFRVTFEPDIKHTNAEGQTVGRLTSGDTGRRDGSNPAPGMISSGFASAWHEGDTAPKGFEDLEKSTAMQKARKTGLWETCDTVGLGSSIPAAELPTGPNS